jgi:hypothetical protein
MIKFFQHHFHYVAAGLLVILTATLSFLSEGYFGGTDNISHYHIARYAFRYPELFLNGWGRPLYTILASPFALFGLQALKLMNILLGVATGWLVYKIARETAIKPALPALVFVCFTPLYFVMMPTALTEILFSFMLVLAILLFIKEKYIASAIVISFLPFARSEGYLFLPLFLIALLYVKQARKIPFLATGIVIFSIAGSFHSGDIFWLANQFPYPVNYQHPIYNKTGSLFHFLNARDFIIGLPLELLFIAGLAGFSRDLFARSQALRKTTKIIWLIVIAPFLLYVVLHSLLYWRAMGGSAGLERVMAAVLPLAALVSLKGLADLLMIFNIPRWLRAGFIALVLGTVAVMPFLIYNIPYPLTPEEVVIRRATEWLKKSPYADRFFLYTDGNVPYYLKADPFRKNPAECKLFGDYRYLDTIHPGTILVWDGHFGANESKIPIDSLLGNKNQRVIAYFRPDSAWTTFGGGLYDCYITLAMHPGETADNYAIRDSIQERLDLSDSSKTIYSNTFEYFADNCDPAVCSTDTVHSGKFSFRMNSFTEFSPGFAQTVSTLPLSGDQSEIFASVYIFLPLMQGDPNTSLVISFEHENKSYLYTSVSLNDSRYRRGRWNRVALKTDVPVFLSPDDVVKAYVWNPGKQQFYFDDFHVFSSPKKYVRL